MSIAKWIRMLLTGAFVLGLVLPMIGCNTVEGAGKDIEAAGRGISNTAEDANPYK